MIKNSGKAVIFVIIFIMLSLNFNWAATSFNITPKPEAIRGDGESLVWMSYTGGNWAIYHMTMSNGKITKITDDTNTQGYPAVWNNYIVWQDNRGREGAFDIYLYDINSKTEKKISNIVGNHQDPLVADNKVVWINDTAGKRIVQLYDISTETISLLSSNDSVAFGLEFDGTIAAWMDSRGGAFNIYMASTEDMTEKQLTYGIADEVDPLVSNGKVVWRVKHNDVNQVYMYEASSGYITRLTVGTENHTPLAFSGETLIIKRGDKLISNNVDSITDTSIYSAIGNMPDKVMLHGNQITWFDGGRMIVESLDQAIARVPKEEVPKPPSEVNPGGGGGYTAPLQKNESLDEGRRLITAGIDNLITFEDEGVTFIIPKGAFSKDTYLNFSLQDKYWGIGYTPVTNTFIWEFEGEKPALPIEVIISYDNGGLKNNHKKISAYNMTQEPLPIQANRSYDKGEFSIKVNEDGKAALMIYSRSFTDMKNHWAHDVVDIIASQHIIAGYSDGTFKPNRDMTRAEFVKVLVSGLYAEGDLNNTQIFEDVPLDFWGFEYISTAHQRGWVMGDNGKFKPNDSITRQEMITILMRVYEDVTGDKLSSLKSADLTIYTDNDEISQWAVEYMEKAVELQLIQGYDNLLVPKKNATRAEAATLLYRYLELLNRI